MRSEPGLCKPGGNLPAGERRRHLRITAPFPILVRGTSRSGKRNQIETEIDNLGTEGVFLRASRDFRDWKQISVVLRLSLAGDIETPAPIVAARAEILRVEAGGRLLGYALALKNRHFL